MNVEGREFSRERGEFVPLPPYMFLLCIDGLNPLEKIPVFIVGTRKIVVLVKIHEISVLRFVTSCIHQSRLVGF
jgi:hypothetical protein